MRRILSEDHQGRCSRNAEFPVRLHWGPPTFLLQRLFPAASTDTEPGSTFWSPAASCHVSLWTTQPNVTQCVLWCKLRSTPPATQPFWVFTLCWAVPVVAARWYAVLYVLQSVWSDCCWQLSRTVSLENPEPLPISCQRGTVTGQGWRVKR